MKVVLISNNDLSNNCNFLDETNIEIKKRLRPLSISGEALAKKIAGEEILNDIEKVYSDASNGCLASAKYLSEKINKDIVVSKRLHDCKVGDLKGKTIKMLSYFQEHDFSFKLDGGESLIECGGRISSFIKNILNEGYDNVAIYLPKRCILAYLINYVETGYNLDERLVLTYNGEVILDNNEELVDIFAIEYKDKKLMNISNFKLES